MKNLNKIVNRIPEGQASSALTTTIVFLIILIVLLGISIGYGLIKNRDFTYFQNEIANQKLLSQRIATATTEAAAGENEGFDRLSAFSNQFETSINAVKSTTTNSAFNIIEPSLPDELDDDLDIVDDQWQDYKAYITAILSNREAISAVAENVEALQAVLPRLTALSEDVAASAAQRGASTQTTYIATRQPLLVERFENNLNQIISGNEDAATVTDQLKRDLDFFARVVRGLTQGSSELNIQRIDNAETQAQLNEQLEIYNSVQDNVNAIISQSPLLSGLKESVASIQEVSPALLASTINLEEELDQQRDVVTTFYLAGAVFGALSILAIVLIAALLVRDSRRRAEEIELQNKRNEQAVEQLLTEIENLAEGDLTAHVTVTEDFTGSIGDAINYSVEALRSLVQTINDTAVRVSSSSEETQSIADNLAEASSKQASEVTATTNAISTMAATMEQMSHSAMNSAEVALKSVEIANKGADTVRRNISGMDTIRETIQETSKRIKRLGESSQQISEIVALITDIADRTNILALNAAIQASSAGEAGRGFAVVADEVQRLAERAGDATKQISALVETIQSDTNEAVSSMEQSTAGVVTGAKLAEEAGDALNDIRDVSQQLANLIQDISQEAQDQADAAVDISQSMNVIQSITVETSESTNRTARSIGKLTELATELRASVDGFKLPDAAAIPANDDSHFINEYSA